MIYYEQGSPELALSPEDLRQGLYEALEKRAPASRTRRVLAVPPDITRYSSRAGLLTAAAVDYYRKALTHILPALGTHAPMTEVELAAMFPGIAPELFRPHNWQQDLTTLGRVPADYVREVSGGLLDCDWPAQVNRLLTDRAWDLILSIGQVVPHEVIGFSNHNKNIFIGTGGAEGIHKSHYLGALYGMERIMGRIDSPVRQVLDYASRHFAADLPILYVLTVIGSDESGQSCVRGLYIGDGFDCYRKAAALSRRINIISVPRPFPRAVVYLPPREYRSTWLGNKAIYRTRMAMADGGRLQILAPGLRQFGEAPEMDRLIRKYGYRGISAIEEAVAGNRDLQANLAAAAHLIHGSSEGRFSVTYAPGKLEGGEIQEVGYACTSYQELCRELELKAGGREEAEMPASGWRRDRNGEAYYFINDPARGLWALADGGEETK